MKSKVAAVLTGLQDELLVRAGSITAELQRFEDEINDRYLMKHRGGISNGKAVVVLTAGAPGAGKSTLVRSLGETDGIYQRIDPDDFKVFCLDVAAREGLLSGWISRTLPDGKNIQPGELSTLVQKYSTDLSDALEVECVERGENYIREGSFSWHGLPDQYLKSLETADGYQGYHVMAVEAGRENALRGAEQRWWDDHQDGNPHARFLPSAAVNDLYESPNSRYSLSLDNALTLLNDPRSAQLDSAQLTVLDRTHPRDTVKLHYQHVPGRDIHVETIMRDVDQQRPSGRSLMDQVKVMKSQLSDVREWQAQQTQAQQHEQSIQPPTVERDPGREQ